MGSILSILFQDAFDTADAVFAQLFETIMGMCMSNPLSPDGYLYFPWVTVVMYYLQGIGLAVVVMLRVGIGIKDGIFKNGGDPSTGQSAGQWLFESLKSIVLICAMPAIMHSLVGLALFLGHDILSAATGSSLFVGFTAGIVNVASASFAAGGLGVVFAVIIGFVVFYYISTIVLQCLKRQIQLVFLSILSVLVVIKSGQSNGSDIATLFSETLSIGILSGLQLLFLVSVIALAPQLETMLGSGLIYPIVIIAMFGAIKKIPTWVEKYLPNTSTGSAGGGRQAGLAAGMVARSAITKAVR